MFGYIRVNAQELRVREYECYRALYCGLCKHMGKCTGQCSRLSLSYDFVFLAAVRIALSKEQIRIKKKRCLIHPLRPRKCVVDSPALAYCANASALLTYHKLADDLADEKGFKKARARLAKPFFAGAYRRAKRKYPQLDQKIKDALISLSEIEKNDSALPSADEPAMCFAHLMEAVFSQGLEGTQARIASAIGNAVGHWIYLADAADDYPKDCQKDRYNPFRRLYPNGMTETDRQGIQTALTLILSRAEQAYLLADSHPQAEINEILANILYLGMPIASREVLSSQKNSERDQKQ